MDKSPDAFRTISEVAEDLDLPQHVLRFWETRFSQIRPLKRGGGRRYYRPDDVDLLKGIRHLLYGEGYTIKGVQRILKSEGVRFVQGVGRGEETVTAPPPETRAESAEETVEVAATPEPILPHAALRRLRGALDDLREADRVLSTLDASEPLRE
jgi:DNA-binding transcriptional MerR regulator